MLFTAPDRGPSYEWERIKPIQWEDTPIARLMSALEKKLAELSGRVAENTAATERDRRAVEDNTAATEGSRRAPSAPPVMGPGLPYLPRATAG